MIRQIEFYVGRPLQWAICFLHFTELLFRHLFQQVDGSTEGPNSFCGPTAQQLVGCETLPVIYFEPIDILSTNQKYFLDIDFAFKT